MPKEKSKLNFLLRSKTKEKESYSQISESSSRLYNLPEITRTPYKIFPKYSIKKRRATNNGKAILEGNQQLNYIQTSQVEAFKTPERSRQK